MSKKDKNHEGVFTIAIFISSLVSAQASKRFPYQSVIRNACNSIVNNQPIDLIISILQGSITGSKVFVETQSATTTHFGLVNLEIGGGTSISGSESSPQIMTFETRSSQDLIFCQ